MSSALFEKKKSFPLPVSPGICLVILLFVLTFAAYWPALRGGILWDDEAHITRPGLQSLNGLGRIWFDIGATQQYYPVLHTAFWLEHHIWGDSTTGYHVLNVILHTTAACLFALILIQLSIRGAWIAAFIFALHPVCVESVAWISEQKNTLSAVFYLLAMLLYLRHVARLDHSTPIADQPGENEQIQNVSTPFTRDYYIALACFVAAILSKSVTATLPAALLVILWWKRGKLSWERDVQPLLPWFGIGIVSGLFTSWVERKYVGAAGQDFSLTAAQRILVAGRDVWFYLQKLVWPRNLMFIYPRWDVNGAARWQYLFAAGVVALLAAAWLIRGRTRGPLAALLFFVGSLVPALGFVNAYPFIYSFVADHFQYLASLGVITLAATLCREKWQKAAAIVVIGILGIVTRMDSAMYRDSETLYQASIQRNPNCWMCYNNLGLVLFTQGRVADAGALYARALQVKPDYAEAQNNIGTILSLQRRVPAAMAKFEDAVRMNPEYADAHNNLGNVLVTLDRPEDAMPHLQKALQLKHDYPEAKLNMGAALLKMNRIADAIENLRDAVRLKPNYAEAHGILGVAWYTSGQLPEAKAEFEQAIRLNPNYEPPRRDLAETLWELGQPDEAISQLENAIRLDPNDAEAHQALGKVYGYKGRPTDAVKEYEAALRLRPDDPGTHTDFALLFQNLKRPQEALAHYQEAIRLKPDYADAHYNLGLLLLSLGRRADGIEEFKLSVKYDPSHAEAHDALGGALYDSGRPAEAVPEFAEAARLKPDLAGVRQNLEMAKQSAAKGK